MPRQLPATAGAAPAPSRGVCSGEECKASDAAGSCAPAHHPPAPSLSRPQPPPQQNPAYKGKWSAPLIDNPKYKGPWKARDIPNPDYVKDEAPLAHIGKVGIRSLQARAGGPVCLACVLACCQQAQAPWLALAWGTEGLGLLPWHGCLASRASCAQGMPHRTALAPSRPPPAHTASRLASFPSLQVGAAAIEIWTMDDGYSFDNVVVSNSAEEAAEVGVHLHLVACLATGRALGCRLGLECGTPALKSLPTGTNALPACSFFSRCRCAPRPGSPRRRWRCAVRCAALH